MIHNEAALRPDYVPRDLYHREGQLEVLQECLRPVTAGVEAENVCLFGPSGSGKTTIARYALERVDQEVENVRWGYANCLMESSTTGVLHSIVDGAGLRAPLQRPGTTIGTYIDRLRESSAPIVAVIDEAYVLDERELLAKLYEIRGVSWIAIAIDEPSFFSQLDDGIRSRIQSARPVTLDTYSIAELSDILWGRIEVGLAEHRIDADAVEAIADRAAGNARDAIALLRQSAHHVDGGGANRLTTDVVDEVEGDARRAVRSNKVDSLGTDQRLLYDIVRETGAISAADLHREYQARAASPRPRRTRRRYLKSLEGYELIESTGSGRGTEYRTPRNP